MEMPADIKDYQLMVPKWRLKLSIGFGIMVRHSVELSVCFAELTGPWEVVLDEMYKEEGD